MPNGLSGIAERGLPGIGKLLDVDKIHKMDIVVTHGGRTMSVFLTFMLLIIDGQRPVPHAIPFEEITGDVDGQWVTVKLTVNTAEDEIDVKTFYGCNSDDPTCRSVCFRKYIDLDERFPHLVTGKLRVIHHPPMFHDDGIFDGFMEYRLEKAIVVP